MSLTVFLVVISAAVLHAAWNAAVKGSDDKVLGMAAVMTGQMLPGVILICIFPWPSHESLPWLAAGIVFHIGYQIFLMSAYKIGDFTQVYPIARGTGPMLVTLVSIVVFDIEFAPTELIAIALIVLGIISLSIVRQSDGLRNPKAAFMAFCTGCCIAGYSLSDGMGARASESAIGYMSMLMVLDGIIFAAYIALVAPGKLTEMFRTAKLRMFGGGFASFLAYLMVVWAFTQAPIAIVTTLRETSIVFAVLIGVFVFRERLNLAKLVSTMLALAGAALLRFGRYLV
ncbi:MAG: DMT family transporter [Pseudomonadota bacterium]